MWVQNSARPSNALGIQSQWVWHTNKGARLVRYTWLFVLWVAIALGYFAPTFFIASLLWCLSFLILFMACLRSLALLITIKAKPPIASDDANTKWPKFTILVPLYQEAHMVNDLVKHLLETNYPHSLLDIILVVEEDDLSTCQAVKYNLHPPIRVFEVPPSEPRTKPKALNAAFLALAQYTSSSIITVYDAEDRPHPNQLRQAALAFIADDDLAVVQAPLGFFNDKENILTALFGLEYAALFHVWNPALAWLGLPFTLGGTSNHIRRDILEKCGGWDSCNVTEDADLSFRIHALNRPGQRVKIGTIAPPTNEEAVSNIRDWTSQRSRWLKGYMQTWCVHMRFQAKAPDCGKFLFSTRLKNIFSLHITIGASLLAAFLHLPSLIIIPTYYLLGANTAPSANFPFTLLCLSLIGYCAAILSGIIGALRANKPHLIKYVVLMPFYWLLYFWPALIAAYEIIFAPSYWRKTNHLGITKFNVHYADNDKKTSS